MGSLQPDDDGDHYEPVEPEVPVLRPEAGAYVGASQSWAKMHMRLHDRFGQAYYIDPFDGEEKPAAAWVPSGWLSLTLQYGRWSKQESFSYRGYQIGGDLLEKRV